MINSDFHIHSTYCDGKNSLEELICAAVDKKMDAIGFSGHSHTSFDESYCMSAENTEKYIRDIRKLKLKYKDSIEIYLGIEKDRFSDITDLDRFDYVIGSVHYAAKNGVYIPVDESAEILMNGVNEHYEGDIYSFCEDYFRLVCSLADDSTADIIGHFDLVTKFNERDKLFDTTDKRYVSAVNEALYLLAAKDKIMEINTGAISRGYRTIPYPDEDILIKWRKLGGRIIFSGDAHSIDGMCFKFDQAERLTKKCGFKTSVVFKNGSFEEVCL